MKFQLPLEPVEFKIEALVVVNDKSSGYEFFRGSTPHEIGSFAVELNSDLLEYASKFTESKSGSFEEFKECFGDAVGEIQDKLGEVLGLPRFDHGDVLADIENSLFDCAKQEIADLCNFLELPRMQFLKTFVEPDGFIVDRVFEPADLIADYRRLKSGSIDEDEFIELLSSGQIEFTVECHMVFCLQLEARGLEAQGIVDMLFASNFCDHLDLDDDSNEHSLRLEKLVYRLVESLGHLTPS